MVDNDEMDSEDYEEQIEQMMIENGMLLHAVVNVLVRKGIIAQDEIDAEIDKLYDEMDQYDDDDEDDEDDEDERE